MKIQEKIKCKICELEFKSYLSLVRHTGFKHNLKSKEYYDKYLKQENEGFCLLCNKETKYLNVNEGYQYYCSKKCTSIDTREKAKQTYFEKTGYNFSMQNPESREKAIKTNMERYNCENPFQNEDIKEKSRHTCLEKYGKYYYMKTKEAKENFKSVCLIKYGVENPFQNEDIKEKSRQTMKNIYNCEYNLQTHELFEKQQQSSFKYKDYIMKSGNIRKVQGYEPFALNLLIEKFSEEDILTHRGVPTIKYHFEDKNRVYYPDIYIPSENLIIEVKSYYTYKSNLEKNLAKQQACLDQGYNFEFWIFDKKEILEIKS